MCLREKGNYRKGKKIQNAKINFSLELFSGIIAFFTINSVAFKKANIENCFAGNIIKIHRTEEFLIILRFEPSQIIC